MKYRYFKRKRLLFGSDVYFRTHKDTTWAYRNRSWEFSYEFNIVDGLMFADYMSINKEEFEEITEQEAFIEIL